ncbi:restriction endonuclease [Nocardia gipuzkoensis]|uniref:restriction endonuclease n=1 Tax=Nocardia gipuzkoensis TaxID=2749991 RepID=UPI0015EEB339
MLSVPSFEAAENSAAQHMRALGFPDAKVTPRGADGGIDGTSSRAIAQVKWHTAPTGRPDVQSCTVPADAGITLRCCSSPLAGTQPGQSSVPTSSG